MTQENSLPPHLSAQEAQARLTQFGFNELPVKRETTTFQLLWSIISEPIVFLLVLCTILYLSMGTPLEATFLAFMLILIIGLSLYQESKAENALRSLKSLSAPRALVLRDGIETRIPARELVPGDLIYIREGDRVAADAHLCARASLVVDESLLTGESAPVHKATPQDEILSGSLVVKGEGYLQVSATGLRSSLGKIGVELAREELEPTLLQRKLGKLTRFLGILAALTTTLTLTLHLLRGSTLKEGILHALATAIALLPEEFPVVLSIYLALGAWRLSKQNVLARKSSAIENLGSITSLCVDKTGTLTENRMRVETLRPHAELNESTLLFFGAHASQAHAFDPMDRALHEAYGKPLDSSLLLREFPLSHELPAFGCAWKEALGHSLAVKGAPEFVAKLCQLSETQARHLEAEVSALASTGLRVLGVARSTSNSESPKSSLAEYEYQWCGLIGFLDPLRQGVEQAIATCKEASISVTMITGDHPVTARAIAEKLGLPHQKILTGSEVAELSEVELRERISEVFVFARMKPEQKLRIVEALQAQGAHVAMTGDGVNDAPSLKWADVGVAMGKRGSDVAREASDIVLLDDHFATLVQAIAEGRRIYDNIRKSFQFLLLVHLFIGGIAILPTLFGLPILLLPLHLVFIEFCIDPSSTLVFDRERGSAELMRRPPRNPKEPIFGRGDFLRTTLLGALALGSVLGLQILLLQKGYTPTEVRNFIFPVTVAIVLAQVVVYIRSRPALQMWGWICAIAALALGLISQVPILSQAFSGG